MSHLGGRAKLARDLCVISSHLTAELRSAEQVDTRPYANRTYFTASYLLGRGGISETSTGSNSNLGSSASGANVALVVFNQFLSSRSGKSGL